MSINCKESPAMIYDHHLAVTGEAVRECYPARPSRRLSACPEAWRWLVAIFRPSFFAAVAPLAPILSRRASGFLFLVSSWQESGAFFPCPYAPIPWPHGGSVFDSPALPFSASTLFATSLAAGPLR